MYHKRRIVTKEQLVLPKCMYLTKNILSTIDDMEININDQVAKFVKNVFGDNQILDLEKRQDKLLSKLDSLYERIKTISSMCKSNAQEGEIKLKTEIHFQTKESNSEIVSGVSEDEQEIVLTLSPEHLPWYINYFLKNFCNVFISWHIHSTVKNDKLPKIDAFLKKAKCAIDKNQNGKINLRLIFHNDVSAPQMKLSSLDIPIIGTVNILRYLCYKYNKSTYHFENHEIDNLLDLCFLLEKGLDNKEFIFGKLFANSQTWIYYNKFSIVDLAVFNVIKQQQSFIKYVPKQWLKKCEEIIL